MVNSVTLVLLLAAVALVQQVAEAATYVVGDNLGWTVPSGGAATYATWAAQHTYAPGDHLVFNFAAGVHDVATVTKAAFDSCSSTNPTSLQTIPPVNVTLRPAGEYYFLCTFSTHCSEGQKLAINVTGSTSPPASPPSSTPPPATAPTASPPRPNPAPTAPPPSPTPPTMPPPSAATPAPMNPAPTTPPPAAPAPHGNAPVPVPSTPGPTTPAPAPRTPPSASPAPHGNAPAPAPNPPVPGGPPSPPSPTPASPPGGASPPRESPPPPPAPSSATRKAVAAFTFTFILTMMSVVD